MYNYLIALLLCLSCASLAQSVDPTKPLNFQRSASATSQVKDYVLQSIIKSGQNMHVVINGKLMALGDQIGPYELITITKQYVVLSSAEKELKMSLFSPVVAK